MFSKKKTLAIGLFDKNKVEQTQLLKEFIEEFNKSMLELTKYDILDYVPMTPELYKPEYDTQYYHVYAEDIIVGYFGLKNDKNLSTTWVVEFYIQPDFRTTIYCQNILNFIKNYMCLEKTKYLSIGVFNIPSVIKLCKKLGFNTVTSTLIMKIK